MLQIIGWILCTALFCFGISVIGNANYQIEGEDGEKKMTTEGNLAAAVATFAAFGFAFLLYVQGNTSDAAYSYSSPIYSTDALGVESVSAEAALAADATVAEAMTRAGH